VKVIISIHLIRTLIPKRLWFFLSIFTPIFRTCITHSHGFFYPSFTLFFLLSLLFFFPFFSQSWEVVPHIQDADTWAGYQGVLLLFFF